MKDRKILYLLLTILWTVIIFTFTLQPGNTSSNLSGSILSKILAWFAPDILNDAGKLYLWHSVFRKCAHFAEYFVLGIFSANMFSEMGIKHKVLFSIGLCMLVAAIDETLQRFVPGRAGRITDVLIDSVGACSSISVWLLFRIRKRNKTS